MDEEAWIQLGWGAHGPEWCPACERPASGHCPWCGAPRCPCHEARGRCAPRPYLPLVVAALAAVGA